MNEPTPISSELLARFVSGEADAADRGRVSEWAELDPANRRELDADPGDLGTERRTRA